MKLLIEFFCEEIPGRMQRDAQENGKTILTHLLQENGIEFDAVDCLVASRRLTLMADNVPSHTKRLEEEKRGPRISSPLQALNGFLKSVNIEKEQLRIDGDYYFADIVHESKDTKDLLPIIINQFLDKMPWPKSMRWHNPRTGTLTRSWIRPIRHVTVMLDNDIVTFDLDNIPITTSNKTRGHRYLTPNIVTISNANSYLQELEDLKVVMPFQKRHLMVKEVLEQEAGSKNLIVQEDLALLDEVTGLVDFPFASIGKIPEKFMTLPSQVLSTSMRVHQKYFTLLHKDGSMAPFFGVITNVPCPSHDSVMMSGFERVLIARLSDALFFYETDVKISLEQLSTKCESIIFHEKTGTLSDKLKRIICCTDQLDFTAFNISSEQIPLLKRSILLCKSDLFTQMVGEFPELQGLMGRIYAKAQGEHDDICDALENHYQPLGPSKAIPTKPLSRILALLDKVDTLVGFIGNGILPTGNKDPLAIRRTALGVIRLLVEAPFGQTSIDNPIESQHLSALLDGAIKAYGNQGTNLSHDTKKTVLDFIKTRFDIYKKSSQSLRILI